MWEKFKLAEVCEIIAGQSPESKYYNQNGEGLPFFQGKADFGHETPKVRYWCSQPTKIALPNDILLSVRAPVGPTNICDVRSCIGRGLASIRVGSRVNYRYLYWWFKSYEPTLARMGNGSTFSAVTTKEVKELEIPLPPLHIQEKIADTLDKADALRKKDQELLKKYDELAQSIFYDMFGDPIFWFNNWEKTILGKACKKITDGEHGTVKRLESGKLYLMARNIRDNYLDFSEVSYISESDHERIFKRCNPEEGDLLLVCVGATIGRASIVPKIEDFSLARSVALIKPDREKLDPKFLYMLIKSDYMQKQIANSGNSSAQAGLYTGKINDLTVFLPPMSLQLIFGATFCKIQELKNSILINEHNSDKLFKGYLKQYFS